MTAPNQQPIYTLIPHVSGILLPQANAVAQSTGLSSGNSPQIMYCAFKAAAAGSFLDYLKWIVTSDTAGTQSTATVLKIFLSKIANPTEGSAVGATAVTDTFLFKEYSVGALNADHATVGLADMVIPFGFAIQTGWCVLVCQHTAQANAVRWNAVVIGGDYSA